MKNKKLTKIFLAITVIALCIGAVFAMSASAEDETEYSPEVFSQNIKIGDQFYLAYAVDASTVEEAPVTLKVYATYPGESVPVLDSVSVDEITYTSSSSNLSKDAYVCQTNAAISMTALTDEFYVQATDAAGNTGAVKRYSVAEYLYQRLATSSDEANPTAKQRAFYESIIEFGKNAQLVANETANSIDSTVKLYTEDSSELVSNFRYVTVTDGKLDGCFTAGVYPLGTVLDLSIDDAAAMGVKWSAYSYACGYSSTDEAIASATNVSSVTVADVTADDVTTQVAKIAVVFGSTLNITYREGYNNLDSIAAGATWGNTAATTNAFTQGATAGAVFETLEGHGTVIHGKCLDNSGKGYFRVTAGDTVNNSEYTSSTGNAFETSFDIKMMCSGDANDAIRISLVAGNNKSYIVRLYQYDENGEKLDKLKIENITKTGENTYKEFDVDPSGWFHVRAVTYKSSNDEVTAVQKWYIYINEDNDNPVVFETPYGSREFADLTRIFIYGEDNDGDSTNNEGCYVDNVFVGFINETEPGSSTSDTADSN